jgi:ABC-2 type transport system permease protein
MDALMLRQLRHHLALLSGIAAAMFGFELLMVWVGASIDVGLDFDRLLEAVLPEAMQRLIGDQFGMASFRGAVAFGFKHPFVLVAAIAAVISLGTVPASERETGLLDLLLARPVTRSRYMAAHVVLLLVPVLLFPVVLLAAAAVGIAVAGGGAAAAAAPVHWAEYIGPAFSLAPLLLVIGGYTLLFAAGSKRRGRAVTLAVAVTLAFYTFEFLASLWPRLDGWERATIFDYYRPVSMVNGEAAVTDPVVLLLLAMVLIAGAFARFQRQQL